MNYRMMIVGFIGVCSFLTKAELNITGCAKNATKMKLAVQVIGTTETILEELLATLAKDMEFSGQFQVSHIPAHARITKKSMHDMFQQGYSLLILLAHKEPNKISYGLYDTSQKRCIVQKVLRIQDRPIRIYGHQISDILWPYLTGNQGCFSSRISYCKEQIVHNSKKKHIFCADYDGTHEQPIYTSETVQVAPRWNRDKHRPLLFFSEYTDRNIRLVALDSKGHKKVVSNFDGLNMQPSFSADGTKVVYCASRGKGNPDIYYCDNKAFKRLTHNQGVNISPTFGHQATTVYFCSDYERKTPRIYCYNLLTREMTPLIEEYSMSPSYCQTNGLLAYVKRSQGIMQVWIYNPVDHTHTCMTTSPGNKDECSWSECGNYVIYTVQRNGKSLLAQFNRIINAEKVISDPHENITYPSWSGANPLSLRV